MTFPRRPTPDEAAQAPRLAWFRKAHSEVTVLPIGGRWQAIKPEANGETVVTRDKLGDVLDRLSELYGGQPDPDSG
jgi:hypothetical protein